MLRCTATRRLTFLPRSPRQTEKRAVQFGPNVGKTISWTTQDWEWFESQRFMVMTGGWFIIGLPPLLVLTNLGWLGKYLTLKGLVPTAPSTKNEFWKVATGPKFRCCCDQPWYDGLCRWENSWHCMQSNLALENISMPIYAHLVRLATFDDTGVYDCWKHPNKGASLWSTSSLSADISDTVTRRKIRCAKPKPYRKTPSFSR